MITAGSPTPEIRLYTRVLLAGGLGLLVVTGLALAARSWLQLGTLYPGKAATFFGAIMAIACAFVSHHPHSRLGPANHVTMVRAMLVALMASLLGELEIFRVAAAATGAAIVLTVLDGVDGWLARRTRMTSEFGARFDMETDALLIMVMSALVWQHEKAGAWVLLGGGLRYAFGAAGWLSPWMARPLLPTRRGQTITVCHIVGLSTALAPFVPTPASEIAAATTLTALIWSFSVDVGRQWRKE